MEDDDISLRCSYKHMVLIIPERVQHRERESNKKDGGLGVKGNDIVGMAEVELGFSGFHLRPRFLT